MSQKWRSRQAEHVGYRYHQPITGTFWPRIVVSPDPLCLVQTLQNYNRNLLPQKRFWHLFKLFGSFAKSFLSFNRYTMCFICFFFSDQLRKITISDFPKQTHSNHTSPKCFCAGHTSSGRWLKNIVKVWIDQRKNKK